ncbi:pirin family protein [Alteromonas oceanisediminis]|uniref:pirin family protein n=1 Tax=Alteromonas oceanisediminis TaxID=2836180 RepID=UPI001BDB43CA|nr:pirin family protein [Alteromonas oceanisediminis]MBT0587472.1 pirin family protein [Alteromonas oceanisediminis]
MSIETEHKPDALCAETNCTVVEQVITPKTKELGGFSVRRVLPAREQRMVGPWLFFDHMGPADFPAGEGINVRPHPHIHLATVTYLFEGEILHRDSLGSEQAIRPGDVNLMVAGRGIVHSERERAEVTAIAHRLHGLQLWLALPEAQQEMAPEFMHYPDADIPYVQVGEVMVKVIMGQAYGKQSPVKTFAETLYIEAGMMPHQSLILPAAEQRAVYVAGGTVTIGNAVIQPYQMAILSSNKEAEVTANTAARIAVIGGEVMQPRHMYWNFASTSRARIEQAKQDWQAQRFEPVVGDEDEFIPLPG